MIKKEIASGPTLVVSAGDFGANRDFDAWGKTEFIYDIMAKMDYDAMTPGETELMEGLEAAKKLYARHPGIEIVSANIRDKAGNPVWPESAVIEKDGIKYGVTGVTNSAFYNFNITRGKQSTDDFSFEEAREALQRVIPDLRQKSDVVVVLMHEGPGDAKKIVDEIPGMDVVIVGHNPGYLFNPERVGQTLLVRPGNRGQYLEVLELTLDDDNRIVDYNGEGKPLGDEVAKDPIIDSEVSAYEKDWTDRKRTENRKSAAKAAVIQGTEKYVGDDICARCHMDIYTKWSKTAHARAYQTLVDDNKQNVAECVSCHVTGYGEPTGYEFTVEENRKQTAVVGLTDTAELRNVQCESCHGMGTFHGTSVMQKVPDEETCRNCHIGEFAKDFDYKAAIASGAVH